MPHFPCGLQEIAEPFLRDTSAAVRAGAVLVLAEGVRLGSVESVRGILSACSPSSDSRAAEPAARRAGARCRNSSDFGGCGTHVSMKKGSGFGGEEIVAEAAAEVLCMLNSKLMNQSGGVFLASNQKKIAKTGHGDKPKSQAKTIMGGIKEQIEKSTRLNRVWRSDSNVKAEDYHHEDKISSGRALHEDQNTNTKRLGERESSVDVLRPDSFQGVENCAGNEAVDVLQQGLLGMLEGEDCSQCTFALRVLSSVGGTMPVEKIGTFFFENVSLFHLSAYLLGKNCVNLSMLTFISLDLFKNLCCRCKVQ